MDGGPASAVQRSVGGPAQRWQLGGWQGKVVIDWQKRLGDSNHAVATTAVKDVKGRPLVPRTSFRPLPFRWRPLAVTRDTFRWGHDMSFRALTRVSSCRRARGEGGASIRILGRSQPVAWRKHNVHPISRGPRRYTYMFIAAATDPSRQKLHDLLEEDTLIAASNVGGARHCAGRPLRLLPSAATPRTTRQARSPSPQLPFCDTHPPIPTPALPSPSQTMADQCQQGRLCCARRVRTHHERQRLCALSQGKDNCTAPLACAAPRAHDLIPPPPHSLTQSPTSPNPQPFPSSSPSPAHPHRDIA